jgi:hypothetical protein
MRLVSFLGFALLVCSACGPDDLFVNASVGLDSSCKVKADDEHALPKPVFDIARGPIASSHACDDPFVAQLWVDNPNGDRARVTSAEVRLMDESRNTLQFATTDTPLPNPFIVPAASPLPASGSGVVQVEAIPAVYAPLLANFVGSSVLAELKLYGETESSSELEAEPFILPIEICDGCRSLCASSDSAADATCSDPKLGASRELCVDPEC